MSGPAEVPFEDHGTSSRSAHETAEPHLVVAADAQARARLARLAGTEPPAAEDRVAIGVFQGEQRTGGYAIRVDRIVRDGATLEVHAAFASPPADAFVIQVLTSPVHVVSVARADVAGVDRVLLLDREGMERASATVSIR